MSKSTPLINFIKFFKLLIILIILFTTNYIQAQIPEHFPVDTLSNTVIKNLPFDRPFFLNFRGANSKSIYNAFLLEWEIDGNISTFKKEKNNSSKLHLDMVGVSNVYRRSKGVDIYVSAQPPDKSFAVLLSHHFDGDLLDELLSINLLLKESSQAVLVSDANKANAEADAKLMGISKKVRDKIQPITNIPATELQRITNFGFDWITDNDVVIGYRNFYTTDLHNIYQKLDNLNPSASYIDINTNNLKVVTSVADAAKLTSPELSTIVSVVNKNQLSNVLEGTVSLGNNYLSSSTGLSKIDTRLKNLNSSLQAVEKLIFFVENLDIRSNAPSIPTFITSLSNYKKHIETNRDILEKIVKDVKIKVDGNINLTYSTWAFGNNELWDLKTRGSYQIIPDVGIVGIYGIGNNTNEYIVRPYIGASIYLRPVDKSVPYHYFDKRYRFLHRFSFNIGLTTGKIEKGEFSDFYNGITFLSGMNYKIIRPLSFSFGLAYMQRKNINPAIEDKKTTINPYLGLSIDLDFTNGIQKLTGKLY